MGIIDNQILQDINKFIKSLNTKYTFKTDDGSFETAIEFTAIGYFHPPKSKTWEELDGNEIKCPDLLDWHNRRIIEYEEEPKAGKRGDKLGKKGHTEESEKDYHRDQLYRIAGFKILKIWETDYYNGDYQSKLKQFLLNNN